MTARYEKSRLLVAYRFIVAVLWVFALQKCGTRRALKELVIRITKRVEKRHSTIKLDGQLTADVLGELKVNCASVKGTLYLDLGQTTWIDAESVAVVKALIAEGALLSAASPFVGHLLKVRTRKLNWIV